MVVEHVARLSERRTQTTSAAFPADALASIRLAVETVPASVFDGSTKHKEIDAFDVAIADDRITLEVEKSERENVSDGLLKFQKEYRTQKDGRPKLKFGCLIVPVNYRGSDNLYYTVWPSSISGGASCSSTMSPSSDIVTEDGLTLHDTACLSAPSGVQRATACTA